MEPQQTKRNLKGVNYRGMSASAAAKAAATRNNVRQNNRTRRMKHMSAKNQEFQNRLAASAQNRYAAEQAKRNFIKFWEEARKAPPPRAPSPPRNNKTRRNIPKNNRPNYYNALKIPKTATNREIRIAQRKLALEKHPNKGGDEEEFKKIQVAQETLSNNVKKNQQDEAKGFKKAEPTGW